MYLFFLGQYQGTSFKINDAKRIFEIQAKSNTETLFANTFCELTQKYKM